jgi:hypothetical protein
MLDDQGPRDPIGSLVALSQMFDLSSSAMRGTLSMLAESSTLVREVDIRDTRIDWVLDINGRTVRSVGSQGMPGGVMSSIFFELADVHARHHASVEPTFLIIDSMLDYHHPAAQIAALERLQTAAEHAQIAIITHSPQMVKQTSLEWTLTVLDHKQANGSQATDCPVDFEIEATTISKTLDSH